MGEYLYTSSRVTLCRDHEARKLHDFVEDIAQFLILSTTLRKVGSVAICEGDHRDRKPTADWGR
jgi:hypothetical protein